jgi:hypothetical protein
MVYLNERFSFSRRFLSKRTLNFDKRQIKNDAVPSSSLVPLVFTMNGYDLANGHGEKGSKKNHTERKEGLPNNIAFCNNVPDCQDRDRRPSNNTDQTYGKADKIDRWH